MDYYLTSNDEANYQYGESQKNLLKCFHLEYDVVCSLMSVADVQVNDLYSGTFE